MSTPMTFPVDPTLRDAMKASNPAPDPKSKTVSPGFNFANKTGFPQPSKIKLKKLNAKSLHKIKFFEALDQVFKFLITKSEIGSI